VTGVGSSGPGSPVIATLSTLPDCAPARVLAITAAPAAPNSTVRRFADSWRCIAVPPDPLDILNSMADAYALRKDGRDEQAWNNHWSQWIF
jgi:hypothetical protein